MTYVTFKTVYKQSEFRSNCTVTMFSKPKPSSSKGEKRKHVTLTLNQKLEIIKRLEKGENRNVLMNEFNIGSSTIYDIKKQKDELMKFAS